MVTINCDELKFRQKFLRLFFIALTACLFSACRQNVQYRPVGYYKLGKVSDLLAPETAMPQHKLILRYDDRGFSVMSTMCTYDLTYLERKKEGDKEILKSTYTSSSYDLTGKVLSGPAVADLPYYELKIDEGVYGGPKDTLYAYVGKEVPKDWRLPVPK